MKKILLYTLLILSVSVIFSNTVFAEQVNSVVTNSTVVEEHHEAELPSALWVIPFVLLLGMIATGPLFYHHFWEKWYPAIAIVLGLIVGSYYLFYLHDWHHVIHTLAEYFSFIALLSSLFVASGGILIKIDKKSTPMLNVIILFIGAVIANVIGTTGASMLLIRPFLRINKGRIQPYQIIFFIFLVSNIGGALTPIGDPPLFLGFLKGVEFFWTVENVWYIWLPTVLLLLAIFYFIDARNKVESEASESYSGKVEFVGLKNVIFLIIILVSVFIDPSVMSWVPDLSPFPIGIREIIMFAVVFLSFKFADKNALKGNEFEWEPIKEVAYLFIGIFLTMIPALQLIAHEAFAYGTQLTPSIFYWATGSLSGVLDNAPTYLNFLSAALGKFGLSVDNFSDVTEFQNAHAIYLQALSVAAVFFGSLTYIGNGPNFMVKSITERAGVRMPSFFAYIIKYSLPILIPVFIIVWFIFFYGRG